MLRSYAPYCLDQKDIYSYGDQRLSIDDIRSLPWGNHVLRIRDFLAEFFDGFPRGYCHLAAKMVSLATGLEEQSGYYSPIHRGKYQVWNGQTWNRDAERGLLVDITQDQFVHGLPRIVVLEEPTTVLTPDEMLTRQQQRFGNDEALLEMLYINLL